MLRSNRNTIEGERAGTVSQLFFSDGLFEKGMEAGRDVFFGEKYMELPHRAGSGCLTATAFPKRDSQQLEPRFILERKYHVKDIYYLMHCLYGLSVDFFLHDNKLLKRSATATAMSLAPRCIV